MLARVAAAAWTALPGSGKPRRDAAARGPTGDRIALSPELLALPPLHLTPPSASDCSDADADHGATSCCGPLDPCPTASGAVLASASPCFTAGVAVRVECAAAAGDGGPGVDGSGSVSRDGDSPYACPAVLAALSASPHHPVTLLPGPSYTGHQDAHYSPRVTDGADASSPASRCGCGACRPTLPLNDPLSPIRVRSALFNGFALLFLPGLPSTPPGLFEGRKRRFVLVMQGRFRRPVSASRLFMGCSYRQPLSLDGSGAPQRAASSNPSSASPSASPSSSSPSAASSRGDCPSAASAITVALPRPGTGSGGSRGGGGSAGGGPTRAAGGGGSAGGGGGLLMGAVLSWLSRLLARGGLDMVLTGPRPHVTAPILASANVIHVARPGEQPHPLAATEDTRLLGSPFSDAGQPWPASRRRAHFRSASHRSAVALGPEHVFTFACWDKALGYADCRLHTVMGGGVDLVPYLGGQPLQLALAEAGAKEGAEGAGVGSGKIKGGGRGGGGEAEVALHLDVVHARQAQVAVAWAAAERGAGAGAGLGAC
ncbi:hypothetical protein HYH03_015827 [Edaphochlamys debaryana]|uniref:Domain of unknown function at the cortex 1 domain-containing protein n=1 Tax=Edaphochlamys debaryana TaxID=47281 RepID=A0A835XT08_9CHLO|nr:hypothetical protein HYH03_015827 [Edaphochlamys debaryana]|eukprot:KAG2485449.1 hypothetical protein HYH03_015827 [Edaphochlamys debaryana]